MQFSFTPEFGVVIADIKCVTRKWFLAAFNILMNVLVRNVLLIVNSLRLLEHHHFWKQCPVKVCPSACYIPEIALEENQSQHQEAEPCLRIQVFFIDGYLKV